MSYERIQREIARENREWMRKNKPKKRGKTKAQKAARRPGKAAPKRARQSLSKANVTQRNANRAFAKAIYERVWRGRLAAQNLLREMKRLAEAEQIVFGHELQRMRSIFERSVRKRCHLKGCAACDAQATCVHHILSLSAGGTNRADNLIPLCDTCHRYVHPFMQRKAGRGGEDALDAAWDGAMARDST
jgi:predicted HNH restriction endonuclease